MTIREQLELREVEYLSPFATLSSKSKGREREEEQCDVRLVFQRDRDRILHSKAFRRLSRKHRYFFSRKGRSLSNKTDTHFRSFAKCKNDCESAASE